MGAMEAQWQHTQVPPLRLEFESWPDLKWESGLPLASSLQYRSLTKCMYWFPVPFQLPAVIWPVQC